MKKVSDIFLHKERKITAVSPSTSVLGSTSDYVYPEYRICYGHGRTALPGNHDGKGLFT